MATLSIGLPIYNGAAHVRNCLDSVLNQTFQDFEIFISDNASTDGTQQICEEFTRKDSRIKYVRQTENIGAPGNFRFVFEQTSSPLFKWMAHDDWIDPDWLSKLVPLALEQRAIVFGHLQMATYDGVDMAHQANCRKMEYKGHALRRQITYAIEPANLGKANIIYGVFPRDAITERSFEIFSGFGAPGDVMMLTDCLRQFPILFAGPTRLYKRVAQPRAPGAIKEKRPSVFERTMVSQFMTLEPPSFRIAFLACYPVAVARMKFERKIRRILSRRFES
ncbi:MAG: glycosyltransferase family 2 protein [Agrobacterium cavarae]|uniref:glycosyltransferase family 2 protein n=1 Tax=Agrobacterium cavarae TaxID=2528239 RepID=UPI0031B3B8A7